MQNKKQHNVKHKRHTKLNGSHINKESSDNSNKISKIYKNMTFTKNTNNMNKNKI